MVRTPTSSSAAPCVVCALRRAVPLMLDVDRPTCMRRQGRLQCGVKRLLLFGQDAHSPFGAMGFTTEHNRESEVRIAGVDEKARLRRGEEHRHGARHEVHEGVDRPGKAAFTGPLTAEMPRRSRGHHGHAIGCACRRGPPQQPCRLDRDDRRSHRRDRHGRRQVRDGASEGAAAEDPPLPLPMMLC